MINGPLLQPYVAWMWTHNTDTLVWQILKMQDTDAARIWRINDYIVELNIPFAVPCPLLFPYFSNKPIAYPQFYHIKSIASKFKSISNEWSPYCVDLCVQPCQQRVRHVFKVSDVKRLKTCFLACLTHVRWVSVCDTDTIRRRHPKWNVRVI